MTITLNGQAHTFDETLSVSELLQKLDMQGKPVVIELNHQALLPREFSTATVDDGAEVEIITIAAGG